MTRTLGEQRWPGVAAEPERVLLVPVGSTEQHGPHLPLDTDTRVAVALAERAAERLPAVATVAPAVSYGASGEHRHFPGTISIGTDALANLLVELGHSADHFAGIVFVNGHGGNAEALARAVDTLRAEGRQALAWSPAVAEGDAHAGRTETSLLLALAPHLVALEVATAGATATLGELASRLRADGVVAVSSNGVLGDPAGASAVEGNALLERLGDELADEVRRFCNAGGA